MLHIPQYCLLSASAVRRSLDITSFQNYDKAEGIQMEIRRLSLGTQPTAKTSQDPAATKSRRGQRLSAETRTKISVT